MARCKAITSRGVRCKRSVSESEDYCGVCEGSPGNRRPRNESGGHGSKAAQAALDAYAAATNQSEDSRRFDGISDWDDETEYEVPATEQTAPGGETDGEAVAGGPTPSRRRTRISKRSLGAAVVSAAPPTAAGFQFGIGNLWFLLLLILAIVLVWISVLFDLRGAKSDSGP